MYKLSVLTDCGNRELVICTLLSQQFESLYLFLHKKKVCKQSLKIVSLIYFIVLEIKILTKFRSAICYMFKINCKGFEKMHAFSINMQ